MANDKLTWVELRKAVAQMANTSEQEAGQFLQALLDGIVVGLKQDNQVKIKGIGTFSQKAVAPRKSVNIATGEEFIIDGYNKLSFSAESNLKESVEKRLEQPKTSEIVKELNPDPLKKLGEQADEIVDILAELGQAVSQPSNDGMEVEEVLEVSEDLKEETEETKGAEASMPPHKPSCSCHKGLCWAIVAVLLALLIGAGCYFRDTIQQWWQCMQDCQSTTEEVLEVAEVKEVLEVEEVLEVALADKPREYVNFIGIEKIGKDSRLAWIAYKYYAQKDLWVFIYEANRDIIKHPAHVRTGQVIRIPELSEEYRNLYNPELQQLVDSLAAEYLKN